MSITALARRAALAAALSVGIGGAATTAVPGLDQWPPSSVMAVVAAITILSSLLRKVLHVAFVAVALTAALVIVDAATGGHIQSSLNLGQLLSMVRGV